MIKTCDGEEERIRKVQRNHTRSVPLILQKSVSFCFFFCYPQLTHYIRLPFASSVSLWLSRLPPQKKWRPSSLCSLAYRKRSLFSPSKTPFFFLSFLSYPLFLSSLASHSFVSCSSHQKHGFIPSHGYPKQLVSRVVRKVIMIAK